MLQQACTSLSHLSGTLVSPQPCTSLSHLTGTLVTPQPYTKLIHLTGTSVTPQPCTSILSPPLRGEGLGVGSFCCCHKLLPQWGGWEGAGLRGGGIFLLLQAPPPKGGGWEGAGLLGGFYFLLLQAPPPKGEDGRGLRGESYSCCYKPLPQRGRMGGGRTFRWFLFPAATSPYSKGGGWEGTFSFAADDARVLYLYIRRPPPFFNPQPQKNRVSSRNPHQMSLFTTSYHPLRHTKSSVSSHLFYPTLLIINHFLHSINNIFR